MRLPFVFTIAVVLAQAPPDLSGTWVLDVAGSTAVGGGRGGGGGEGSSRGGGLGLGAAPDRLLISRTANALVVIEHRGDATHRVEFALDGRPVTNTLATGRSGGATTTYRTAWRDGRLETTISLPARGENPAVEYRDVRYLDADGRLVIDMTMAGRENLRRLVYRRHR